MPIFPDPLLATAFEVPTPEWRLAYILAMAMAAIIVGIAKSGFGGGVGILAVPLVASVVTAQQMLGLLIILFFVGDCIAVWQHREKMKDPQTKWHLKHSLIGLIFGIILGTGLLILFGKISELDITLRFALGVTCLFFVALQIFRMNGGKTPHIPDTPASGVICGIVVSFVSTVTNSAGPLLQIYLLEHKVPKKIMVSVPVLYFCINNFCKIMVYASLGFLDLAILKHAGLFSICVPLGSLLGVWMHDKVPERIFTLVIYLGTALAAINLIYSAVQKLG